MWRPFYVRTLRRLPLVHRTSGWWPDLTVRRQSLQPVARASGPFMGMFNRRAPRKTPDKIIAHNSSASFILTPPDRSNRRIRLALNGGPA